MTDQTIGIIGVGMMGLGIATNIQQHGYQVTYLSHAGNQDTKALDEAGAVPVQSPAELVQNSDILILCVTGALEVEDVMTRQDGVLADITPDTLIIDCSTSLPETSRKIADMVHKAGGAFLDAPMTRTPKEAMEGRLNLIVGGDKEVFTRTLPLFKTFAENINYAGDVGAGHTLKLLHNFVSLGFSTLLAEACASAKKAEVNADVFQEVLATGGGNGVILDRMTPYILEKDKSAFRFTLAKTHKDMDYYVEMCARNGSSHDIADSIKLVLQAQLDNGRGENFVPELIDFMD